MSQQERDDLWSSLTDDEKQSYKLKAREYNNKYGTDVSWRVYEEEVVVKHWGEECKHDSSKCCTVSVPAPSVEPEEDWDEGLASATATLWQGQIDDEDFPPTLHEATQPDNEEAEERLIAAGQEDEDEEEEWAFQDVALQETVFRRGEDFTLEEYFETIELDHPGYAHHRKQLPRTLFRK